MDDLLAVARARFRRLTPEEALEAAAAGAVIIDTRCSDAIRDEGAIPGAVAIPLSVLPWRADPSSPYSDPRIAEPATPLVLICAHGYSSSMAVATLLDLGRASVTDVDGGFEAWRNAGLPVVDAAG